MPANFQNNPPKPALTANQRPFFVSFEWGSEKRVSKKGFCGSAFQNRFLRGARQNVFSKRRFQKRISESAFQNTFPKTGFQKGVSKSIFEKWFLKSVFGPALARNVFSDRRSKTRFSKWLLWEATPKPAFTANESRLFWMFWGSDAVCVFVSLAGPVSAVVDTPPPRVVESGKLGAVQCATPCESYPPPFCLYSC